MAETSERRERAMRELTAQREAHHKKEMAGPRRGLVLVYTGAGKGKTTAALGLLLRASGRGLRTRLFQFLKHERAKFGEHRSLDRLGIPYQGLGDGFTWRSRDLERSADLALQGWRAAREALLSGDYDLIVLDEFTYPLKYGWVEWAEVEAALRARPAAVHVVITGRDALPELITLADTVTEMALVKHAYDQGIPAQAGIEH